MEQKKVTYTGLDTEDVTQMLEEGNRKQAEKGWQEYRVDMLSSSTCLLYTSPSPRDCS